MREIIRKIIFGEGVLFDLTKWLIFFVVILLLIQSFLLSIFIVDGFSMEPNLRDREAAILLKNGFIDSKRPPGRGDVVVVRYPGDPEHKKYVKRVIGLPNEKLEIKASKVYINDQVLPERYLPVGVSTAPAGLWQMGEFEYFLMGDNRTLSNDSRYFGPVERRFFVGRAVFIFFPRLRAVETNWI